MARRMTLFAAWMATASGAGGCGGDRGRDPEYPPVFISEMQDPLAGERTFTPWRPPRQMAAFVHPHEDRVQGIMVAGHWIMVLLGEGSWYFEEPPDREPVPDAEATAEEIQRALGAVGIPQDAVVPFRARDGGKP
jgi:hypothetical protein